jgi:HAD superfamily phosphatase (TIGR01681 family)
MNIANLCIIFDIDETMVQYLHDPVGIHKWETYKKLYPNKIEAHESAKYTVLFRPGLRDFIQFAKANNIDIAIWTYGNESYSQFIENEIMSYAGLDKSPFTFVYSITEIKDDLANGMEEKDLRRVYQAFPERYTATNTILVDNRAANIFHESNRENGIVVESFDITAGYSPNKDTVFQNIKRICEKIRNVPLDNSVFSETNVNLTGIRKYYKKYMVNGTPVSLVSEGTVDQDPGFYPEPKTRRGKKKTRGGINKYNNRKTRQKVRL